MRTSNPSARVVPVPLRAFYTIAELAKLAQVTRHTMVRLLQAHHIKFIRSGRAFFVPLCEIEEKMRPLWRSLCTSGEARRLRGEDPLQPRR